MILRRDCECLLHIRNRLNGLLELWSPEETLMSVQISPHYLMGLTNLLSTKYTGSLLREPNENWYNSYVTNEHNKLTSVGPMSNLILSVTDI